MSDYMDVGMYPEELPPQCREWKRFLGGKAAFRTAEDAPDEWIPVLDLMPREMALILIFFRRIQPQYMRQSLLYTQTEQRFCAWPTHLLKDVPARRGPVAMAIKLGASWLRKDSTAENCRLPLSVGPMELWSALLLRPLWEMLRRPKRSMDSAVGFLRSLEFSRG